MAFDAQWSHPDISARATGQRAKVPVHGLAHTAVCVGAPCSHQFYGVVNEVAVLVRDERADEIPGDTGCIIELTIHKEQASVFQAANVADVPRIRDQPDFLRRCVGQGQALGSRYAPIARPRNGSERSRNEVTSLHRGLSELRGWPNDMLARASGDRQPNRGVTRRIRVGNLLASICCNVDALRGSSAL